MISASLLTAFAAKLGRLSLAFGLHALIDGLAVLLRQVGTANARVNHLDAKLARLLVGLLAHLRHQRFALVAYRRREFVERELKEKQETLRAVRRETGHQYHEAIWMLGLSMELLRTELRWIRKVEREFPRRAVARNPDYLDPLP